MQHHRRRCAARRATRALARGYATSYEELEAHLHAVGAPIYDHQSRIIAAVSISGPAARMPRQREPEFVQMLLEAARRSRMRLATGADS